MSDKMSDSPEKGEFNELQSNAGELNIGKFAVGGLESAESKFVKSAAYMEAVDKLGAEFGELTMQQIDESIQMKAFLRLCAEKDIIQEFDTGAQFDNVNKDLLQELSRQSFELGIDENDGHAYYINELNERVEINFDFADDFMHRQTIETILPEISFDVLQDGNLKRAKEAEAIYKVITLNKIYKGLYSNEIYKLLAVYNFEDLGTADKELNFVNLLKVILEEAPAVTRVIVSAMNLKLTKIKTKKELRLLQSITRQEDRALKDVKLEILALRFQYDKIINAEPTKARRAVKRDDLYAKEREIIDGSEVSVIYDIFNLNAEAIPVFFRIQISRSAKFMAYAIKEKLQLDQDDPLVRKLATKFQRRGFSEYLIELKAKLLEQFRNGQPVDIRPKV